MIFIIQEIEMIFITKQILF